MKQPKVKKTLRVRWQLHFLLCVCGTGMLVYIYAHMYTIHASIALTTYHLGLSSGCLFLLPGGKLFAEGDLILFTAVS